VNKKNQVTAHVGAVGRGGKDINAKEFKKDSTDCQTNDPPSACKNGEKQTEIRNRRERPQQRTSTTR
jgi:hypothetical protein